MEIFPYDCPHCGTKKSGFIVRGRYELGDSSEAAHLLECPNAQCSRPAIVVSYKRQKPNPSNFRAFYPKILDDTPGHLPDVVDRFYRQARSSMPHSPDAAGAMYRKALEAGLKELFPDVSGTLFVKIKKLRDGGHITEALADFADEARLDGNAAVHDDVFTRKQAEELGFFTKMALTYLFTLPNMIAERKARIAKEDT